jgi:hypothetical protein
MMLLLVQNVPFERSDVRRTDRECAVSGLPVESRQAGCSALIHFDDSRFNSRISVATSIVFPKRWVVQSKELLRRYVQDLTLAPEDLDIDGLDALGLEVRPYHDEMMLRHCGVDSE